MDFKKLGLGTTQFGLNYGISNISGKPTTNQINSIIGKAQIAGIGFLDTAPAYGDAESVVGNALPKAHSFKIISKTIALKQRKFFNVTDQQRIINGVVESLDKLKLNSLYGLLIHQSDYFLWDGIEYIVEALQILKSDGLVKKIGASVYGQRELDTVLENFTPDIIQLPLSPIDQRLQQSGHIELLRNKGIEVHVRSLFLQGLLLSSDFIPEHLKLLEPEIINFQKALAEEDLTPLEGCLLFGLQNIKATALIIGVNSLREFTQILTATQRVEKTKFDFSAFASRQFNLLSPATWAHS
jgi:aryl-alcohol dehydrogenase-like predicted oxidoreductase